jgi:Predicted integral membrane protein
MEYPVFKRKYYKGEAKKIYKREPGIAIVCGLFMGLLFSYANGFTFDVVDMFDYRYIAMGFEKGVATIFSNGEYNLVVRSMFSFLPIHDALIWLLTILYLVFLFLPLTLALQNVFKEMAKYGIGEVDFFYLFKDAHRYLHTLAVAIISKLFIALGSLLFFFPGYYLALRYYYVDIIAVEEPDLTIFETLKRSAALTRHIKFDLFILPLSFCWWMLLAATVSVFSFGFGLMVFTPYLSITIAYSYFDMVDQSPEVANE